ncbi:MAG: hypothetical protein H0V82_00745 [Candidatus Protochlamydia sp.]|nr:hypothetical protein [Candidatus Protochlamydia sp.]
MIDGFAKPIQLPEVNGPSEKKADIFFKALAFGTFNLISFGIMGSIKATMDKNRVRVLELEQDYLQSKAQEVLSKWEAIEIDLHRLKEQINSQPAERIHVDREVYELTNKINDLKNECVPAFLSKSEGITRLALNCILFLGNWIANVITLGVYGTYQNYIFEKRIALLVNQNTFVNLTLNRDLKQSKAECLIGQVGEIANKFRIQKTLEEIRNTDPVNARNEVLRIEQEIIPLGQELQVLNQQKTAAEVEKARLRQENQAAQSNVNLIKRVNDQIELERIHLQNNADSQMREVAKLREKAADRDRNILAIEAASARVIELQKEIEAIQSIQKGMPQVRRIQSELGPILKYTKRAEDLEIKGSYGISEDDDTEFLNDDTVPGIKKISYRTNGFSNRYKDKKTAAEVVQAALGFSLDRLLELGRQPNPKFHFNNSAMIYCNDMYGANKNAVYRFMAVDFIENGKLFQDGCGGFSLKLNRHDVKMGSSHPEYVQTYRIDPITGSRQVEKRIRLTHNDDFTPPMGDLQLALGIDPASAKWIYAQLNDEEKRHLFNLLMEPLIANDDVDLIAVQNFMENGNPARVKLVRTAYELICDIGLSFDKKFAKSGLLNNQWERCDEWDESVLPFEKPEMKFIIPEETHNEQVENWIPNLDCLLGNDDQSEFALACLEAQLDYAKVFANFSRDLVENPLDHCTIAKVHDWGMGHKGIKHQYHLSHQLLGVGCLFSNLTVILMNKADQVTRGSADSIKNAIAKYLDDQENSDAFEQKIKGTHGMSVKQYQNWLRGIRGAIDNYALGDLEIELTAKVFGIKIGVFVDGRNIKINEYGLMVPDGEGFYYGPNTKETLYLYNMPGSTYYGLWPRLKSGVLNDDAEAANQSIIRYRNQINNADI